MFPKTTDTLEIKENADDPQKEQPATEEPLYRLNRGVGKPSPTLPAAPDLDVGYRWLPLTTTAQVISPSAALTSPTPTIRHDRDRIDGLTYTLSGADAAHFHIVPATGQILTLEKLNYEIKNEYKVTVKATDPDGESDSIAITIEVTDVEEVPVPITLVLKGADFHTYEENGTDAVGEYEVGSFGGATANPTWTLEGADMSHFTLTGSGNTRMLEFTSAPDYDMPRGQAMTNTNTYEVTLKVTDPSDSEIVDTLKVRVDVTDVDELGTLSGDDSLTQAENGTDAVGTYRLTGTAADTADWSLDGADMSDFMLEGSGSSRMLKFKNAPDYEMPRGMAMSDDNTNTYMVTVQAEAGGEMDPGGSHRNGHQRGRTRYAERIDKRQHHGGRHGFPGHLHGDSRAPLPTRPIGAWTVLTCRLHARRHGHEQDAQVQQRPRLRDRAVQWAAQTTTPTPTWSPSWPRPAAKWRWWKSPSPSTNVEEPGTVTLTPARPSVGTEITATLEDDDIVSSVTWSVGQRRRHDGTFTNISGTNLGHLHPRRGRRGQVPAGHGNLHRRLRLR